MRRIAIIGCSGGGKSTLATALGERLRLPVVHLDVLFWRPGWVESEPAAFRARVAEALAGDAWISEGNFITGISDLRFPRADAIVWIEQPRLICLWRAIARVIKHRRTPRPDMAAGCAERFDLAFYRYIWTWDALTRPRMDAAIAAYGAAARVVRLRGDGEISAFLASAETC
jgi:adenylate kinase family enzyme